MENLVYKKGERTPEQAYDDFRSEMDKLTQPINASINRMKSMYPEVIPEYSLKFHDGEWKVSMILNTGQIY